MRFFAFVVALTLVMATTARADDGLDRAAVYWGKAPACQSGVDIIVDQFIVGPNGAVSRAGGCEVWVGDVYLAASLIDRCALLVHEWGHLIGHRLHIVYADDPEQVMLYRYQPDGAAYINIASTCYLPTVPAVATAMAIRQFNQTHRAACMKRARHRAPREHARGQCWMLYPAH